MLHNLFMLPFMWFRLATPKDQISRSTENTLVKQNLRRLTAMRSARPITAEINVSIGDVPTVGLRGTFASSHVRSSLKQNAGRWFNRADFSGLDADMQARITEAADNIGYSANKDFHSSMAFCGNPDGEIDYEAELRAREFLEQRHGIRLRLTEGRMDSLDHCSNEEEVERIFFVGKEGLVIDPDKSNHDIPLFIAPAIELELEPEAINSADEAVDCTRNFLESCAELDPLVPPSERILTVVPDIDDSKKTVKAEKKSGSRQSRKRKKKNTATRLEKLQPSLS